MKKINKLLKYVPALLSSIIIGLGLYVKNRTYNVAFEQALYSVMKTSGTSINALYDGTIYVTVVTLILFPLFIIPIINYTNKVVLNIKIKNKEKKIKFLPITKIKTYNTVIMILSVLFILFQVGVVDFVYNISQKTSLFDDYYVDPEQTILNFPDKKKNLIYIFLESTEITNLSKENGGALTESIMPNLEKFALDNVNFSNTNLLGGAYESYDTGWTAAAMITQTSGLPLKLKLKDFKEGSTSLKNVTTIGDILHNQGYSNYLLLGSDSAFGGRKDYFESHHYIVDDYYTAIEDNRIDKNYYEWWGYEDAKLFDFAKKKIKKLSEENEPFNLTLLTVDTHFTDGYVSKECSTKFDNHYANSFYCEDLIIKDFIDWLKEEKFYEDTVIILQGDHPTMQQNFYKEMDKDYVRTTYNAIINSEITYVNNKNRVFTTMDLFPTTLAAMGVEINGERLGLGTNLFSDKKTLAEELGLDELNNELKKYSKYYYDVLRK